MRRWCGLIFALMCLAVILGAAGAEAAKDRHFLWEVNPGPHAVYLLGSLHLMKADMYPLPAAFHEAYEACERIYFETDIAAMETPAVQRQFAVRGRYAPPDALARHIAPATYRALTRHADRRGIPVKSLDRLRPWLCALTLSVLELQRLGFDPQLGIDRHFFARAMADGKSVHYFESVDAQIELMAGMNALNQELFLKQALGDLGRIDTQAAEMADAWQAGDAPGLAVWIHDGMKDYPDLYQRFFVRRNRQWMTVLQDLLERRVPALVVVGAGHLVGPDGLVRMLRRAGYPLVQH